MVTVTCREIDRNVNLHAVGRVLQNNIKDGELGQGYKQGTRGGEISANSASRVQHYRSYSSVYRG
jgi:hypothetical protein